MIKSATLPECKNVIPDNWLSGILKKEVYRVVVDDIFIKALRDKKSSDYAIMKKLRARNVFMYAKVQPFCLEHIKALQEQSFYLVDTNVLFEKPVSFSTDVPEDNNIRLAVDSDKEQVMKLAGKSFKYSRFHLDNAFSSVVANAIKAQWAGNYFTGSRGDKMVVVLSGDKITGFTQILMPGNGIITIDLIAVDSDYRGQGLAARMINYAENNYKQAKKIIVGTQLANTSSISCYEKMGFRMSMANYVFHYHNI